MKLDYEIADYTLRNLINQFDNVFGAQSQGLTYNVMDKYGNIATVSVDSWKKIKDDVRTDLVPITDINNTLKGYISFVDNISTIAGLPTVDNLDDNKIVLAKDTKGIYTKNQYGNMAKSLDKSTVDDKLLSLMKNGENIIFGSGTPDDSIGTEHTLYIDNDSKSVLYKNNGEWQSVIAPLDKTEAPMLNNVHNVLEDTDLILPISNFNKKFDYNVNVNIGEVSLDMTTGNLTFNGGMVSSDTPVQLEIAATKHGLLRSDAGVYNFTVTNIPTTSDDAIVDNNFSANAENSNGIQY